MTKRDEAYLVFLLAALYAIAFSWRLHFLGPHTWVEWPYFRTLDQFKPPAPIPMQAAKSLSQWGLESRALSPWMVLHWICGQDLGINLELPIHLAIAFAGGWVLARTLTLGWLAALTCAVIWPSSSWIYLHFEAGHTVFLPFVYMPWMFACFIKAMEVDQRQLMNRWIISLGLLMTLTFFEGGAWPMFYVAVSLGVLAIVRSAITYSARPLTIVIIAAALTVMFSLPKVAYIPHIEQGARGGSEHLNGMDYVHALFSRDQKPSRSAIWDDVGTMPWWEIGAYVSPFFVPITVVGVTLGWGLAALASVLMATGNYFGGWSPYCLIHKLPFASWTWMAPHWFIITVFCFGVMAAYGAERLSTSRAGRVVTLLLLMAGIIDCWQVSTAGLGLIK